MSKWAEGTTPMWTSCGSYKENSQRGYEMESISRGHFSQELQRLTAEMDKGSNALYDAE
jgi:hypothetical protein